MTNDAQQPPKVNNSSDIDLTSIPPPREWWLDIATPYGDPCDFISDKPHEHPAATNIHVIEHAAYSAARAELERAKDEAEFWKRSHKTLQDAANTELERVKGELAGFSADLMAMSLDRDQWKKDAEHQMDRADNLTIKNKKLHAKNENLKKEVRSLNIQIKVRDKADASECAMDDQLRIENDQLRAENEHRRQKSNAEIKVLREENERMKEILSYLPKPPTEPYEKAMAKEILRLREALEYISKTHDGHECADVARKALEQSE